MTGKESKEILDQLTEIVNHLINDEEKEAFFRLGILSEHLRQIIEIDQSSFNPTVGK